MKGRFLFLVLGTIFLLFYPCFAGAQCPEDPRDNGICDTLYIDIWPQDQCFVGSEPHYPRFPIRVTHDLPDPNIDSIVCFVIPLCYTHTNPSSNCFLPPWLNTTDLLVNFDHSIFRHMPDYGHATEFNWMMSLAHQLMLREWDTRILDLSGGNKFWLSMMPTGSQDQRFWEGSRVLLATMTFQVEDSTTICIDTCFWPPSSRLAFCRSDAITYMPRINLPNCFLISYPALGDCTADGKIDLADVVFLINYLYRDGMPPPLQVGDTNCDGITDGSDVIVLINYLFRGEPEPSC